VGKIALSLYNRADGATLSAGSWLAGAPLANLQQPYLSLRARSTNDDAGSTQFRVDLGDTSTIVRLVALARHNLTTAATYRVTAGTTAGASDVYDSGTLDVWPVVYDQLDLEWEDDNFWDCQITADEAEGYPIGLVHDCGANVRARYWTLYFTDTANPANYVELARLWMGPLWSPAVGVAAGDAFGWEPRSVTAYSLGGVGYSEERAPARVFRFRLPMLSDAEAFGAILDAQRRVGTAGQFWVIQDPDDIARGFKRNFMARARRMDLLTAMMADLQETGFELEEIL
jgi:hypothetical protein